jgi:proteasome lid subunit RPN8/RPN11
LFRTEQVEQGTTHILERIRDVFQHNPIREQGLTVVTNSEGNAVFIPTRKSMGGPNHVSFKDYQEKHFQYLLGVLHSHPNRTLFSSQDILSLLAGRILFEGIVNPSKYYITFRTKDSKNLSLSYSVNKRYLLAMAKEYGVSFSPHPLDDSPVFRMTEDMFSELNMPLYVGNRRRLRLKRIR